MSYDYFTKEAMKAIKKLEKRADNLEGELKRVKETLNIPDVCPRCSASMEER